LYWSVYIDTSLQVHHSHRSLQVHPPWRITNKQSSILITLLRGLAPQSMCTEMSDPPYLYRSQTLPCLSRIQAALFWATSYPRSAIPEYTRAKLFIWHLLNKIQESELQGPLSTTDLYITVTMGNRQGADRQDLCRWYFVWAVGTMLDKDMPQKRQSAQESHRCRATCADSHNRHRKVVRMAPEVSAVTVRQRR
jgi:hypothetical protein